MCKKAPLLPLLDYLLRSENLQEICSWLDLFAQQIKIGYIFVIDDI